MQSGWLRGSARKLDPKSTPLEPVLSLRAEDIAPMPNGSGSKVMIPLYYQGHVYRAGSRIRVTISAPGGDQPIWAFGRRSRRAAPPASGRTPLMPSKIGLPWSPGVDAPTGLPPCPGLRGEPCRTYQAYTNKPVAP